MAPSTRCDRDALERILDLEEQVQALIDEVRSIVERHNQATDGSVRIDAEYSLVVARKRG